MELAAGQRGLLAEYLGWFDPLVGDRRTGRLLGATVAGIIGAESLVAARIAAFPPELAAGSGNGAQRVRRMARGETTKRSELDAEALVGRLRAQAVAELAGEEEVWAVVDMAELRKPHAREMADLMRVRALGGEGTVPGYRTLNVLGLGRGGRRGVLHHRLFSSTEETFASESREIRDALGAVGAALAAQAGAVTSLMDSQFDDAAVWAAVWGQRNRLVCRLKHTERLVDLPAAAGGRPGHPAEAAGRARELARVRTEMPVRKRGQRRQKRQPTTAAVSACPVRVRYRAEGRTAHPGPERSKDAWLVVVRLENVDAAPWLLLTDWPVDDETAALRVFRMDRMRWAIEDSFKFSKQVLGWEDVQLLDLDAVRTLVALGWVAAGFLYHLGVTLEWPEVRLLARLGGWEHRRDRPPGRTILTRGLQSLLDHWRTEAILRDEIRRHGRLPPRLAALLGPPWSDQ